MFWYITHAVKDMAPKQAVKMSVWLSSEVVKLIPNKRLQYNVLQYFKVRSLALLPDASTIIREHMDLIYMYAYLPEAGSGGILPVQVTHDVERY